MSPGLAAELVTRASGRECVITRPRIGVASAVHEVEISGMGRGAMKVIGGERELRRTRMGIRFLDELVAAGYPAPHTWAVVEAAGVLIVVHQWVNGHVEDVVDHALVETVLAVNAIQRDQPMGATVAEPWGVFLLRALREGLSIEEGYCRHAVLRARGGRPARLLARIRQASLVLEPRDFVTSDIAHFDFHHRNVLRRDGRLAAVIDWDSVGPGDAVYDLVTLAYCSVAGRCEPGAVDRLWAYALDLRPRTVVNAYIAHLSLRQLDWFIRRRDDAAVELWTDRSEELLEASA
jgi:hypothetical protein